MLILPAGEDEMVPPTVDREGLLGRWMTACDEEVVSGLSGLVPGADHVVSKPEAQKYIAQRVGEFLRGV